MDDKELRERFESIEDKLEEIHEALFPLPDVMSFHEILDKYTGDADGMFKAFRQRSKLLEGYKAKRTKPKQ